MFDLHMEFNGPDCDLEALDSGDMGEVKALICQYVWLIAAVAARPVSLAYGEILKDATDVVVQLASALHLYHCGSLDEAKLAEVFDAYHDWPMVALANNITTKRLGGQPRRTRHDTS